MKTQIISKYDLKLLKKNSEILRTLHLIELLNSHGSDLQSLKQGGRWSGSTHRKVSIPDIIEDHKRNNKKVVIMYKSWDKAGKALLGIERVLRKYKKCPQCKGEQGYWSDGHYSRSTWSDCTFCEGHGYILKT